MNTALWTAASVLAALFAVVGLMKVARPKAALAEREGMGWVEDFPGPAVKTIGALEAAGAAGLVLPALLDIVPALTAWAASGIAALMAGAAIVHLRRGEPRTISVNLVLLTSAAFVAWGRLGPYPL
ncbi:DoxX family protein [Glycomyces xiaoerkulensis]|uniref:DoxX family protein n=1 Tax=Glycomyces xiaoerkulensis TaxID=2038139 RepID=UPI000C263FE0|nr:DoxX family protein [Glycomyces xiaoerkulensis]